MKCKALNVDSGDSLEDDCMVTFKPIALLTQAIAELVQNGDYLFLIYPYPVCLLSVCGTSVDGSTRKSNNWLDQWQSGKLSTGSRVQSFSCAFPSLTDVPVLLLNQPNYLLKASCFSSLRLPGKPLGMKLVCVIYCVPEWTDDLKLGIAMSRYELLQ